MNVFFQTFFAFWIVTGIILAICLIGVVLMNWADQTHERIRDQVTWRGAVAFFLFLAIFISAMSGIIAFSSYQSTQETNRFNREMCKLGYQSYCEVTHT